MKSENTQENRGFICMVVDEGPLVEPQPPGRPLSGYFFRFIELAEIQGDAAHIGVPTAKQPTNAACAAAILLSTIVHGTPRHRRRHGSLVVAAQCAYERKHRRRKPQHRSERSPSLLADRPHTARAVLEKARDVPPESTAWASRGRRRSLRLSTLAAVLRPNQRRAEANLCRRRRPPRRAGAGRRRRPLFRHRPRRAPPRRPLRRRRRPRPRWRTRL